ncbi:unknown [Haloarcula marismortui ATCC 43049]|uniref:Uncharacterized protein n=1 Tax=Haloarcula marismortui (strain ATCC 43049 / DSM 3752 / JCM 8966 / VKM B-1809) TaxID=272569 RepID=Q5UXE9_HALMA|nr:unknown [Haloarcula marismortui ATCC 43049]
MRTAEPPEVARFEVSDVGENRETRTGRRAAHQSDVTP